jgi:hypothetical protein
MEQWPVPPQAGFVGYHYDHRDGSVGYPTDRAYFPLPDIEQYMRHLLTYPGNYFGLIDQFDKTLQFVANEDGSVRIDIPDPARNGSMVRDATLEQCIALVRQAGPSLAELKIADLVFEPWQP